MFQHLPFALSKSKGERGSFNSLIKNSCPMLPGSYRCWRRGGDSNPRYPFRGTHDFQSCTFNRSVTSPAKEGASNVRP